MTQISILGCGWLGLPLAKALLSNGFSVKGSITSTSKQSNLEMQGVLPFLMALQSKAIERNSISFLEGSKISDQIEKQRQRGFCGLNVNLTSFYSTIRCSKSTFCEFYFSLWRR